MKFEKKYPVTRTVKIAAENNYYKLRSFCRYDNLLAELLGVTSVEVSNFVNRNKNTSSRCVWALANLINIKTGEYVIDALKRKKEELAEEQKKFREIKRKYFYAVKVAKQKKDRERRLRKKQERLQNEQANSNNEN